MIRRAIPLLFLAAASCAAPSGLRREPTGDLQPLDPGLEWVYEVEGGLQTRHVTGIENVGRFPCRVVEIRTGSVIERWWMRWDRKGLKVHRVSDGEESVEFEDPLLLIDALAGPGGTWSFEERHGPLALAVEARYERDEDLVVGDRTYRCARIRLVKRAAGRVVIDQACWYARDVGLVRMAVVAAGDDGESRATFQLKSCNFISE